MRTRNKGMFRIGAIVVVLIFTMLLGISIYYNSLVQDLQDSSCVTLQEVLVQEKNTFSRMLKSGATAIEGLSQVVVEKQDNPEELIKLLSTFVASSDFEHVIFATLDGEGIDNKGVRMNVSDRDNFSVALKGKTIISDPIESEDGDAYIVEVVTSVKHDGETIGVLIGSFSTQKFDELFTGSFEGYGYTYVATNTGEIIVKANSASAMARTENLFEMFERASFYDGDSYATMRRNLVEGRGGHAQYKIEGQHRMMHYDKLADNDWNIFVVVNPEAMQKTANNILQSALVLTSSLVVVFFALLAYGFWSQRRFNRALTRMAYVDEVTGKSSFGKFRLDARELVQLHPELSYMLVKLDIQNFKLVNQMYTRETGDQVLKVMADAIECATDGEVDAFSRVHADEFVVLAGFRNYEEFNAKHHMFEKCFADFTNELVDFSLIVASGSCRFGKNAEDFNQCYENANFAHRIAKYGLDKDIEFDDKIKQLAIRRQEIESRMESALWDDEFKMYLQPKYRLKDERMVGAEALVRWFRPDGSMLPPDEFISIFEENGFITQLDMFMFDRACAKLREWADAGIEPLPISVNFSRVHLFNPDFVTELSQIADQNGTPHGLLEIELTETAMFDNVDLLSDALDRLHEEGFTLSMDDFGTGYSSLGLLKNLPVDVIKIDKNFFGISSDMERAETVIASVMDMARRLGIRTLAEGVETKEQMELLRGMECELVQGYYYARPMPADELKPPED